MKNILIVEGNLREENHSFSEVGIQTHTESLKDSLNYFTNELTFDVVNPSSDQNIQLISDKLQKYIINAGATPKLITSVNESNSFPTLEVPFINLAILPSKPSIIAATITAIIDNSNLPSKANFIEVKPIQTPIRVKIFGKITLVFLFETNFIFLFCCSISLFFCN